MRLSDTIKLDKRKRDSSYGCSLWEYELYQRQAAARQFRLAVEWTNLAERETR